MSSYLITVVRDRVGKIFLGSVPVYLHFYLKWFYQQVARTKAITVDLLRPFYTFRHGILLQNAK